MTTPIVKNEMIDLNKEYTFFSWAVQGAVNPIHAVRADGIYFWDAGGKRYLDFNSQLMNVNIGHGNRKVIEAIKEQVEQISYMYPGIATDPRGRLGEKLAQITPGTLKKTFFSLSGTEANESAIKIARQFTGRQKVLGRYRAFHGQGFASQQVSGDPRRIANEPGVSWAVNFHDPYRYRCLFCRDLDACNLACADHVEQTVIFEGPETIAAIMLEGYSGSSGIIAPPDPAYWTRIREICDKYGILLIVDEVMSGFGRTGKWFGVDHYPDARPDMITMAKGLTSGYMPLGATIVTEEVASYFDTHPLVVGGTYSSHALACAAGLACVEVYEEEGLIENSARLGEVLAQGLEDLKAEHPSVGDVRGLGLFHVIELVKNRDSRAPMSEFNQALTEPMKQVSAFMLSKGFYAFVRWNMIFAAPPLIINEQQLQESLSILNEALAITDKFIE
ncbi:MAG TPA: aminotransferase class III-fold pyridoxal phosphate-dependent enzyme [Aggregatilineales bacterium]|nr:aminotransferase class III-fold pyridoxal phosphate-dependent enzyme [Aggregatilineales bacterium]